MTFWIVIVACAIITFLIRVSFIAIFGKQEIPAWLQKALKYVPPSVLSVIACQSILFQGNQLDISLNNTRLIAGILAALVAWWTRNILITIIAGMAALVVIQLVF
jgi:branched-subunit amino acid transport protein